MRRTKLAAVAAASLVSTALTLPLTTAQVGAAPAARPQVGQDAQTSVSDNLTRKWQQKYQDRQQAALEQRLRRGGTGDVQRLGRDKFARVGQTGKDKIFVVLAEFGNRRHELFCDDTSATACDYPSDGSPQRYSGPRHNEIPKPDRDVDNSTLWQRDFDRKHYRNMYFERMRTFYEQQSSGKYTFDGSVTEWVKVPFNQARYGRDFCGSIVCSTTWSLVRDSLAFWVKSKRDAGWDMERITAYLKTFDEQDRYDFDADGDFEESDGYIDHFQIVHAGGDQAAGDPIYGSDAIWSHRWYAQINAFGTGPTGGAQFGGVQVGEGATTNAVGGQTVTIPNNPTGVWVGDYTIQPENGGLGVFAHEYAHDLGLPDLYDTSGNTGGAENSTGFWTLMSSGSNIGRASDPGIGDHPTPFGAWEKFILGWLDYKTFRAGHTDTAVLRPNTSTSDRRRNGAIVILPDKQVDLDIGEPCAECGERYYYSDAGDDLANTMTREVTGGGQLTAKVSYEIEPGYDYAFLEASTDGGATWQVVETSESYEGPDEGGTNPDGFGISGSSNGWVDLTATVPAGADAIRWRYSTDSAVTLSGFRVDNITLGGAAIGTAETGDEGWVLDGFRTTSGQETVDYLNAYFVDNRQYVRQDKSLRTAYNFGFLDKYLDLVEYFAYQPGALITYWDTSYSDNNVGDHPGHGLLLPVDAHPELAHYPDGTLARPRIQSYDSTFSKEPVDGQRLHYLSDPFKLTAKRARPVFNDMRDWWFDQDEHSTGEHVGRYQPGWNSVDVPKTGTKIRVVRVRDNGFMKIRVGSVDN